MKFPHSNSPLNINSFRDSLFISDEQIVDFAFFAQKPVRPKLTYDSTTYYLVYQEMVRNKTRLVLPKYF